MQFSSVRKVLTAVAASALCLCIWSAGSVAQAAWPVATGFETPDYTIGDLNGQQGWEAVNTVEVQGSDVNAGAQAVRLTSQSLASFSTADASTTQSIVWVDAYCKATPDSVRPELPAPDGASCLLYFDATEGIVCLNGDGLGSGTWTASNVVANDWTRVAIRQDYATHKWDLYVNGVQTLAGLGNAYNTADRFTKFECQAGEAGPMFLDDFYSGMYETPTVANVAATNVTLDSARLEGLIGDEGETTPDVTIYYGLTNGGDDPEAWTNQANLGATPQGPFFTDISGLRYSSAYFFRCYAQNTAGGVWAENAMPFTTAVKVPTAEDVAERQIDPITELFYLVVLGRMPSAEEVSAWHVGYTNIGLMNIDIRFVVREMGRQFFLSEEYEARNRSNAEFISDCYRAFLFRTPSADELEPWLNDVVSTGSTEVRWNRGEVMTMFAESEEFATKIAELFPGQEGNPTRNFVAFMYIGIFDRLVDAGGLEYWADVVMGPAQDKKAAAVDMAKQYFASEEGASKSPTNELKVVHCYRAFLARFPSTDETLYWTGVLDRGEMTFDPQLIDAFGAAGEFADVLAIYFP